MVGEDALVDPKEQAFLTQVTTDFVVKSTAFVTSANT